MCAFSPKPTRRPDWELLGIDSASPDEDDRPLLVAGQPEIRQYRPRFWDAGSDNGDWCDVASVTMSLQALRAENDG